MLHMYESSSDSLNLNMSGLQSKQEADASHMYLPVENRIRYPTATGLLPRR
jgi:hypothetical protein